MRNELRMTRAGREVLTAEGPDAPQLLEQVRPVMEEDDYVVLTTWLPRTKLTTHLRVIRWSGGLRLKQTQQVSEALNMRRVK